MPSVPADRPLPPALPQERGRSAGRLPVLGAAHHHRWGHLRHGADQGGDRQRERGVGTGWGNLGVHLLASFGETCGAWLLFSWFGTSLGPLLVSRYKAWRANSRVWGAEGVPTDEGSNWQTLYPPLHHTGWSTPSRLLWLSRLPLGLLPQTPAQLGQVEEMGGPERWRPGNVEPPTGWSPCTGALATAGPPSRPT